MQFNEHNSFWVDAIFHLLLAVGLSDYTVIGLK